MPEAATGKLSQEEYQSRPEAGTKPESERMGFPEREVLPEKMSLSLWQAGRPGQKQPETAVRAALLKMEAVLEVMSTGIGTEKGTKELHRMEA